MKDIYRILVIGGGAAGIGAAKALAAAGADYLLVEARPRLGGRAWTIEDEFPLDLGCGWLHSADVNPFTKLAEARGYAIDKTPPPWTRPSTPIDFPLADQQDFRAAMGKFFQRLDGAEKTPDAPASSLLEEDNRWNPLIKAVSTYINGVELDHTSAHDFARYLDTEVNWRIAAGYGAMIAGEAEGLDAVLDCPVTEIDRSGVRLRVSMAKGTLHADAAILTVSSALIAAERPRITPPLPDKIEAATSLPLGLADKLFLHLEDAEEFEADSRIFGRTDRTDTGAYHLRPFGRPLIEAYFGGKLADDLEGEGGRAFADWAASELVRLLGSGFASRIRPVRLSQWRKDEFALGSYSYALPGHADDRAILAAPVDNRLFFAGEACHPDSFSTAHGAYITGLEVAGKALAALG